MLFKNKSFFLALVVIPGMSLLHAMEPVQPSFWSWDNIKKNNPFLSSAQQTAAEAGQTVLETPWLQLAGNKVLHSVLKSPKSHHDHPHDDHGLVALHGADLLRAAIKVFVDEFGAKGNGSKASKLVVESIGRAFKELVQKDGEGAQALRAVAVTLQEEFKNNGELSKTVHEFFAMISEQLKNDGKIKESIEYLWHIVETQGLQGLEKFGAGFQQQIVGASAVAGDRIRNLSGVTSVAVAEGAIGAMHAINGQAQLEVDDFGKSLRDSFIVHGNSAIEGVGQGVQQQLDIMLEQVKVGTREVGQEVTGAYWKIAGITVLTVAAAYGTKVMWNEIERRMKIPKLINESSEKSLWQKMRGFFVSPEHLPEMVFAPELAKRLSNIIATTKNIRRKIKEGHKNVKYRNLLLYGLPGTGKTMFAKILAKSSGMDYAMMSGASFAQFKDGQGITEMNKLFEWANNSKNGLLLFIDEAESFLGGRVGSDVTKESYQILINFLNHTGTRSDKFMIVCATNYPQLLDSAMPSRLDDAVEVPLPQEEERVKILQMYRDTVLMDQSQNTLPFMESVQKAMSNVEVNEIAKQTAGLSGRELAGIVNALVSDAAITDDGLLTREIVDNVVDLAIKKNHDFSKQFKETAAMAAPAA